MSTTTDHAALIEHPAWCVAPRLMTYLDRATGCPATKCRACGRWVDHVAAAEPEPIIERDPVSNYRCRDHHDEPVTWRGTGCRACDLDTLEHDGTRWAALAALQNPSGPYGRIVDRLPASVDPCCESAPWS